MRTMADTITAEATIRPVLLAVEDLQWSTTATLAALEQLTYMLATTPVGG